MRQNFWPDFDDLCTEVESFFSPQMSTEWAKQELRKLKQGGSRIEDFMAKFISLKVQGKVSDDFACALLEQAIKPEVLHEVLLTNTDISIWDDFTDQTMKVGRNVTPVTTNRIQDRRFHPRAWSHSPRACYRSPRSLARHHYAPPTSYSISSRPHNPT